MDIIKAYAVKNLCYLAAKPMTPQGIVVHSTGVNNPNLKRYVDAPDKVGKNAYANHWNKAKPGGKKVCVHAFIGYDLHKEVKVAEILPLDICCWGVGKGKKGSYNDAPPYIQFEICEDTKKDRTYYETVFAIAAEYCAHLCEQYGLTVNQIVSHKEAFKKGYGSNHKDPEHWMKKFGETMDDFRKKVSEHLLNDSSRDEIGVGDLVSIQDGATYYSGKSIPEWVMSQNWFVKSEPKGDRVVIDRNEKGTNSICSPIRAQYLTVVQKASGGLITDDRRNFAAYSVKVIVSALNIRKGAGTNTAKIGCIKDKGIYVIEEEKCGTGATLWGKLKGGAGWISLDYVQKLT